MKLLSKVAIGAMIASAPGLVAAQIANGTNIGTTDEEIAAAVEAAGFTLDEIEREGGEIEVEAVLNGIETTFILGEDGTVSSQFSEPEDDDDDDDDDDEDEDDDEDDDDDDEDEDDDDEDDDDEDDEDDDEDDDND